MRDWLLTLLALSPYILATTILVLALTRKLTQDHRGRHGARASVPRVGRDRMADRRPRGKNDRHNASNSRLCHGGARAWRESVAPSYPPHTSGDTGLLTRAGAGVDPLGDSGRDHAVVRGAGVCAGSPELGNAAPGGIGHPRHGRLSVAAQRRRGRSRGTRPGRRSGRARSPASPYAASRRCATPVPGGRDGSARGRRRPRDGGRHVRRGGGGPTRRGWDGPARAPRAVRCVEVLERIGTPEAREGLKAVAAGAPGAPATEAARAALGRLGR